MSERSDVYAYFWVQGYADQHSEISERLRLTPTSTRTIGEIGPYGQAATSNSWQLLSPLPRGESSLQDYLEALLDLMEPRALVVRELVSQHSVGINCVGYYYGANPGLHLSAHLVARLAALNVPIDFDLYNYGEDDAA
jgi:hypothetical protein